MHARIADKVARYEERVREADPDAAFVVLAASIYGQLSDGAVGLLKRMSNIEGAKMSYGDIKRHVVSALMFSTGHLIAMAERAMGVVHRKSPLQIALHNLNGRSGAAGVTSANAAS
mgnify:CR=1 FL=1